MAEGFELVRTVRQHLRRSAALLDEGLPREALAEVDAALALDPQSLPAQALRDRIQLKAAAQQHQPKDRRQSAPDADRRQGDPVDTERRLAVPVETSRRSDPADRSRSFVPQGVNAASWRGFEQRITERRFKALLDTINTSIVAGDAVAARIALDEARELRPDASELAEFEARVAAVPVAFPAEHAAPSSRIWMRAMGAAALFLVGVSLLLGLEWMRPDQNVTTSAPASVAAPEVPAVAPTPDQRPATTPGLGPVPVALAEEEESVPAIVTPPEPLLRPRPTAGATMPELIGRPVALRGGAPLPVERTIQRRSADDEEEEEPSGPLGEVSDTYVAPRTAAATTTPDAGRALAPSSLPDTPVNADARSRVAPPAATVASAVVIPSGAEQGRVEEVLRRYARAYGDLNAPAARAVWPTVDERALARAFQNLSSQKVSFDDCEIDIHGATANASCRGQASYVGKVGSREPRTESRVWRFELRRDGDAWKIANAEARRESTAEYRE